MATVWHTAPPVLATYVHHIDPIVLSVGGLHVWWYGLGFALGFWQMHRYIQRHRVSLHLDARDGFALSLMVIAGVLTGGRAIEILFDEWPFYREHASFIPRYWLGGMATHGLLIGAAVGCGLFCATYKHSLLRVADALVIPGAFLMGLGRLGNFIDGQIVGGITDVAWGVKFPDAEGFRHPVVLYDGLKNLLLVPYLMRVRATNPTPGATAARFVFWYAFLRIFVDLFRDYPTHRLALGTGQTLNLLMALTGAVLLRPIAMAHARPAAPERRRAGPGAGRTSRSPLVAASAAGSAADLLPVHSQQLDAERAAAIWRPASGPATLVDLPGHRYRASPALSPRPRRDRSGANVLVSGLDLVRETAESSG